MKSEMYGLTQIIKWCFSFHGYFTLCGIAVLIVLPVIFTECPSKADQKTFSCFNDYNRDYLNMQKSRRTLFAGVDVEVLRAFCSSYIYAMSCIKTLKAECPPEIDRVIDWAQRNLDGAKHQLTELCEDDRLYELYARHMACFEASGRQSEVCFETIMNRTAQLMTKTKKKPHEICRDLRKVQECVGKNIQNNCGAEAASLVNVLVQPMIWRNTSVPCEHYKVQSTASTKGYRSPTSAVPSTQEHVIRVIEEDHFIGYSGGQIHMSDTKIICGLITFMCIIYTHVIRVL